MPVGDVKQDGTARIRLETMDLGPIIWPIESASCSQWTSFARRSGTRMRHRTIAHFGQDGVFEHAVAAFVRDKFVDD